MRGYQYGQPSYVHRLAWADFTPSSKILGSTVRLHQSPVTKLDKPLSHLRIVIGINRIAKKRYLYGQ